jgi:maltose alpha-D-glucosyltransferase/alpha-amylase
VDVPVPDGVLVHRADDVTGTMLFVHNLGPRSATADLSGAGLDAVSPNDVLADREYPGAGSFASIEVAGYGYRWIRVRRRP